METMQSLLQIIQLTLVCGTILVISFVALLAMPQCKLREVLMPIVGWCVAIFCAVYAISPVDIVPEAVFGPFGYIEDIGALVTGVVAARSAMKPPQT